ncbi:uncharacterized protein LOC130798397 [Amaranthus tricolor]|uniref:uncharacterized protein LOC130798397 n=1 Tax=Amaranthus tricolor TaxID=29722 RepID=UPI00258732F6|nr:uncharacterized protein LOC130798397 [Amaranthus tricolor]XP_057517337.1 uncharacterized protein LOC130798397 [Amaranthus tricolor]XP_057517338.1 uncharacterized protein LOC130798397 [Amaranthus tricolor]XP_057517340.1 uncharacterized protein LOC130798397 [Amaranthus tricolor]XP_057517341.1 uncharacterized protein LOC130798397 [Amaranthus tricolor]
MEQNVTKRSLFQQQHFGTLNGSGAHVEEGPSERGCPRSWTVSDALRQEKAQIPTTRDNFRGTCAWGASRKYEHSNSVEHDGARFYQNGCGRVAAVPNPGNSQYGENQDMDFTTGFSSDGFRSSTPRCKFQRGLYLHPESIRYDRPTYDSRVGHQVDGAVGVSGFGEGIRNNTSGQRRIRSPCRNFLRGQCNFGSCCKLWHPVNSYVGSRCDFSSQHHQRVADPLNNPGCGEGHRDVTLRTSQGHYESNMHNHSRNMGFSGEPSWRLPGGNFLSSTCYSEQSYLHLQPVAVREVCLQFTKGRCTFGASCRYLHGYPVYASTDRINKPTEAAGDYWNSAFVNQYTNTVITRENQGVKNSDNLSGESKNTVSCDKESKGLSVNNAIELDILDQNADLTKLETDGNANVTSNLVCKSDEHTAELMPVINTCCSKKKRKWGHEVGYHEDDMKEFSNAPKHKMPNSLSNNNILSVSCIPIDIKTNASTNNDLENMLMYDHPTNPLENGMTNGICKIVESAQATTEDDTSLVGNIDNHSLQALQVIPKPILPLSRRKLLVLDLNGILVDIVASCHFKYKPDITVASKGVFKRPFCDDFLQFCFEKFDVGIWSSRTKKNLTLVVNFLLKDKQKRLRFCWDQSHCTGTRYKTLENRKKPLVLKELKYLWDNVRKGLPWKKGFYNETNTVLLDDSPYKALRNPLYTAIFPYPYSFKDARDKSLGPGGDLRTYLERLAEAEDVQKFIQENPFGQKPITEENPSWTFYAKIVGAYDANKKRKC